MSHKSLMCNFSFTVPDDKTAATFIEGGMEAFARAMTRDILGVDDNGVKCGPNRVGFFLGKRVVCELKICLKEKN